MMEKSYIIIEKSKLLLELMRIIVNQRSKQRTNINKMHFDMSFQSYIPSTQCSHSRKKT